MEKHINDSGEGSIKLHTSRTTYFNSMVTNRVMDKAVLDGLTIRKMYEYNHSISLLEHSKLSNHLGMNGMIETKDNKFVFIKRFNNVSIGKDTLGCSVSASLKTKYAIGSDGKFDTHGLVKGIIGEIKDELLLEKKSKEKSEGKSTLIDNFDFNLEKDVIAIYRDLVEGGKPQLLFYIKCKLTSAEIQENFHKNKESNAAEKEKMLMDGSKLVFIDPKEIKLEMDELIHTGPISLKGPKRKYKILPSTGASIALVMQYERK